MAIPLRYIATSELGRWPDFTEKALPWSINMLHLRAYTRSTQDFNNAVKRKYS